ncbi:hypothetical protein C0389_05065 [bacterium]|nr:hypothetical protein [bacterium]
MKNQFVTRILFMLVIAMLSISPSFAQETNSDELNENLQKIQPAYFQNDVKLFMEVHSFLERLIEIEPANDLAKYYLAYVEYRLYASKQATNNPFVEKFYEPAVKTCKELIDAGKMIDEIKTILAALYLMRLANNPMEAMALSPQIHTLLGEAEAVNPSNPRIHIIRGIMVMNTPPMFGGSVEKGMESFNKAISLFESNKSEKSNLPNWGYEESQVWLGIGYQKMNNKEKAKEIFTKVLELQPDFGWVKFRLLPSVAN